MIKKIGQRTLALESAPALIQWASVAGKREMEGPLSQEFDFVTGDTSFGEKTWEKAESAIQKKAVALALEKAGLQNSAPPLPSGPPPPAAAWWWRPRARAAAPGSGT